MVRKNQTLGKSRNEGRKLDVCDDVASLSQDTSVGIYWVQRWVTGTGAIPHRDTSYAEFTLSKPVIPKHLVKGNVPFPLTYSPSAWCGSRQAELAFAAPSFWRGVVWVRVVPNLSTSTSWRSQTDYQYTREAPLLSLLHNVPDHPVSSTQYHA